MPSDSVTPTEKSKSHALSRFLREHWAVVAFGLTAFAAVGGRAVYRISPLQPFEEIGYRQKEYRAQAAARDYRNRMIARHLELGRSFLNVNQLEAAKEEFGEALKLDESNNEAQFGLLKAEIAEPVGPKGSYDPEIVERRIRLILKENPEDPHAFVYLGDIFMHIDVDSSMFYYERAIDVDSSVAAAYAGMAYVFDLKKKNADSALIMYERASQRSPWNQTYLNNLAYQYFRMGQYQKAADRYDFLLRLSDRYLLSYYTHANALRLLARDEESMQHYKWLMQLLDDSAVINMPANEGWWYYHAGSGTVNLHGPNMKKAYAYFSAALNAYIDPANTEEQQLVDKARRYQITPNDEFAMKYLLLHDARLLLDARPSLRPQLDAFVEEVLGYYRTILDRRSS